MKKLEILNTQHARMHTHTSQPSTATNLPVLFFICLRLVTNKMTVVFSSLIKTNNYFHSILTRGNPIC